MVSLFIIYVVYVLLAFVGNFPLFLSRVDPAPAGDIKKEAPVAVGDGAKPSCECCLHRDSIVNAAAKVAPAVVNLSVPKGIICFGAYFAFEVFFFFSSFLQV